MDLHKRTTVSLQINDINLQNILRVKTEEKINMYFTKMNN